MMQETSGPEAQYFEMLKSGAFCIQQCVSCSKHVFFPRTLCPHCGSEALQWIQPSGRGEIYSITVVRRDSELGGDYNIALIDLHEGVRLMAHVVDDSGLRPMIGDAVALIPMSEVPGKTHDTLYFKVTDKVQE